MSINFTVMLMQQDFFEDWSSDQAGIHEKVLWRPLILITEGQGSWNLIFLNKNLQYGFCEIYHEFPTNAVFIITWINTNPFNMAWILWKFSWHHLLNELVNEERIPSTFLVWGVEKLSSRNCSTSCNETWKHAASQVSTTGDLYYLQKLNQQFRFRSDFECSSTW